LRVLMVVDGWYPGSGGTEQQARMLSRVLASRGHDVNVLTLQRGPESGLRETIDGIPVQRIAYPRVRYVGAVVLVLRFAWRLLRARRRYDAIHVHMVTNLAPIAGLLRPLLRAAVVVKVSGAGEFEGGVLDPAKQRQLVTWLRNAWLRRVDYVQCISRYTRDRLRAAGYPEAKLCMIPNGVELARFRARDESPPGDRLPTVVFVGRMRPVKGVDVLVRAWKDVQARHRARLVLAGEGPMLPELKRLVLELGIAGSVEFVGEVSAVPELLAKADIYVQPSRQEGLPNAVLEAMAAGLPIVATRVSGNEDVVEDGRLVPPADAPRLAEAIGGLLADLPAARARGRRSRRIVEERFQVSAVLDQLARAYRREL
jgi:glycosyltransferase involved in cell wall biosynthesis